MKSNGLHFVAQKADYGGEPSARER